MTKQLTRRERILLFIQTFRDMNGFSPSVREIADAAGLSDHYRVRFHLRRLRRDGWVSWSSGKDRTLVLCRPVIMTYEDLLAARLKEKSKRVNE